MNGKTLFRRCAAAVVVLGVASQFLRPERSNAGPANPALDVFTVHPAPPAVRSRIETACYDCHSNRTHYPWYAGIQPLAWWLDRHIAEGRAELNFSEFGALSRRQQRSRLQAVGDEIAARTMPLPSYTWVHRDAKLSPNEIAVISAWTEDFP